MSPIESLQLHASVETLQPNRATRVPNRTFRPLVAVRPNSTDFPRPNVLKRRDRFREPMGGSFQAKALEHGNALLRSDT